MCALLCLAAFTHHHVWEIDPFCGMHLRFVCSCSWLFNIPLCKETTLSVSPFCCWLTFVCSFSLFHIEPLCTLWIRSLDGHVPRSGIVRVPALHTSPAMVHLSLFNLDHPGGGWQYLTVSLISVALMSNEKHKFPALTGLLQSLFVKPPPSSCLLI